MIVTISALLVRCETGTLSSVLIHVVCTHFALSFLLYSAILSFTKDNQDLHRRKCWKRLQIWSFFTVNRLIEYILQSFSRSMHTA